MSTLSSFTDFAEVKVAQQRMYEVVQDLEAKLAARSAILASAVSQCCISPRLIGNAAVNFLAGPRAPVRERDHQES